MPQIFRAQREIIKNHNRAQLNELKDIMHTLIDKDYNLRLSS